MPQTKIRSSKIHVAFVLAMMCCIFGIFFCVVKSPPTRAQGFVQAAVSHIEAGEENLARTAVAHALQLNPKNAEAWSLLSSLLWQNGHVREAGQAMTIAQGLRDRTATKTAYAVPAELKLSLLMIGKTDIR